MEIETAKAGDPRTDNAELAEITRRLVEAYRPERVYLFGSCARGTSGADSDYDLLVVVPDDTSPAFRRSARAYEALWGSRGRATSSCGPTARSPSACTSAHRCRPP